MTQLKGIQGVFLERWPTVSYKRLACSIMIFCSGILSPLAMADAPPVEHFTRSPTYQNVTISPSGKYLAATVRRGELEGVAILERENLKPVFAHQYGKDFEIFALDWATDETLLISPGIRLPSRTDYVFPTGEILALNIKNQRSKMLYGYRAGEKQTGSHIKKRENTYASARLVHVLPDKPNYVLIETRPFGLKGGVTQLHRLDVRNGRLRDLAKAEDLRSYFVTDLAGELALRVRYDAQNDLHIDRKKKNGFEALTSTAAQKGSLVPWFAAAGGGFYAFDDRKTDTASIALLQLDGTSEVLHHNPKLQPERFLYNRTQDVWGVRFAGVFPEYFYPDPKHPLAHMHQRLRKTFPKGDVEFTSFSDDGRFVTALVHSDTNPGRYYLLDLSEGGVVELLETRDWLTPEGLREMQPVEIKARDGQRVIAMLTLPEQEKAPAVVLVHGGPHGVYDRWGFDATVQLLASRGYAVLQVNYRGSGGYGHKFERAGYGEWGGLMQQDVTDATQWLADSGSVDPKRICIMGGSFGAYSALTGAFQEPDLYRCAIGYAGVYDLPLLFEKGDIQLQNSGTNYLLDTLGDDQEELRKRSPVFNAEKIKAKVFLAHGGLDLRAPPDHAKRMRKQLVKAGNDPHWLFLDREGHGFGGAENRTKFYSEVLDFLDTNLR